MIERYTRPEMGAMWKVESRFQHMLEVEKAVAHAQARLGLIPKAAAQAIERKGRFRLKRIEELEKTTKHDVIAFVSSVAECVGPMGRFVHYGMTSSDVLDTALSLQIKRSGALLLQGLKSLDKTLTQLAKKHQATLCAGRTHGMHAEPTTFGLKMAGFLCELRRNHERLKNAIAQASVGKLSGAVGTYATQSPQVEKLVCQQLGLSPETVATQVIPRDRHAEVLFALAMIGAGIERLAIELRHLQRTEVAEVVEGFSPGQKGSSAMPHKKNPISAENLTGCARLLRAYLQSAMENIALWHERDISHSSVERVVLPDAFILCDYAIDRMRSLVEGLYIDSKQMQHNIDMSRGQMFSSQVLLLLVKKGLAREAAYKMVQRCAHDLQPQEHLRERLLRDEEVVQYINAHDIASVFSGQLQQQLARKVVQRALK